MRVLILESDPVLRNNYSVYARDDCGYEVIAAETGFFLKDHWTEVQKCDVVVIDLLVPMGGLNCLQLLSAQGWSKPALLHHIRRWNLDLSPVDLKRISKIFPFAIFKRKSFDGANMIWFLNKHHP
jgi:hypothetical protein